jgi:hypothetical protein
MHVNGLKMRLATGNTALVVTLQLERSGYDALVLDLEYNLIGADAVGELLLAALDAGIAPVVRLPDGSTSPMLTVAIIETRGRRCRTPPPLVPPTSRPILAMLVRRTALRCGRRPTRW